VRRRLFVARHPAVPTAAPFVDANVHLSIKGSVHDDVIFARSAAFLDGYPLSDKRIGGHVQLRGKDVQIKLSKTPGDENVTHLQVGEHELTVELYMEPRTPAGPPPRRVDVTAILHVPPSLAGQGPLSAMVDVGVRDDGPKVTAGNRFFTAVQARPFEPVAQMRFPAPPAPPGIAIASQLPPMEGDAQRIAPASIVLPDELRSKKFLALMKACVSVQGIVTDVIVLRAEPEVSTALAKMIRGWRYLPYKLHGNAVPFCYPIRFAN
jgi:hypothetical protein